MYCLGRVKDSHPLNTTETEDKRRLLGHLACKGFRLAYWLLEPLHPIQDLLLYRLNYQNKLCDLHWFSNGILVVTASSDLTKETSSLIIFFATSPVRQAGETIIGRRGKKCIQFFNILRDNNNLTPNLNREKWNVGQKNANIRLFWILHSPFFFIFYSMKLIIFNSIYIQFILSHYINQFLWCTGIYRSTWKAS